MPMHKFGWIPPEDRSYGVQKEVLRVLQDTPLLTSKGGLIAGTGEGVRTNWCELATKLIGYYPTTRQRIGDCVSFGWAKGIMLTMVADIMHRGEQERWPGMEVATEWIYGTSRVLVGRGRLGNSDGSIGSWAARAVVEHGLLFRTQYGQYDLSTYSGSTAKSWGYRGLPHEELEPTADEHPVSKGPALCTSYEQARDALANGYFVPVASNQGFTDQRDAEGFIRASGRWAHQMCFVEVDDEFHRPGLLLDNTSWGKRWVNGPKRNNQPDGTGWVDVDTCTRMLRQNDSHAIPGVDGFERRPHKWMLY
jgi:hypothetical protein